MPKILFTGGGSAGHVTPNIALIQHFQEQRWDVMYAGSHDGIEKELIARIDIPYYGVTTGKLRRQLTLQNLLTPFKVLAGGWQAFWLCRKLKPDVVFSKGGFVAFPIIMGAWLNRIPVIAHESDLTPGLANRMSYPFAKKICITFPDGIQYYKNKYKVVVTGTPIRQALLNGDKTKGLHFCNFKKDKPVLMIFGGSLGALNINRAVHAALPELLRDYQVAHICGKNKIDPQYQNLENYHQYEYLNEELGDVMASADIIISRGGANSIYELISLRKPHILVPLAQASRGDQIHNAQYFKNLGLSEVINDADLTGPLLISTINHVQQNYHNLQDRLNNYPLPESVAAISKIIHTICDANSSTTERVR